MPRKFKLPVVGWTAAVSVPLAVLAVLAMLGLRAQRTAARSRIQDEAAAISASQARLISEQLKTKIKELPTFSGAPMPGRASSLDDVLDSTDVLELSKLRDDPDAGFSPSGLPRQALAALRIEYLAPGFQDPQELVQMLTVEAPSVLTLPALRRLEDQHPNLELPAIWLVIDQLDEFRESNPDGGWVRFQDQAWWISANGDRYLSPEALDVGTLDLPTFAAARFSSNRTPLTPPLTGEVLVSTPVEFPSPLSLDWILTSPATVDASAREQTRWIIGLLLASLGVSGFGLFAILRMVREERRLGELKGQFVASVSHELRAPIGSIRLMADALEAGRVEAPREFHRLISRESERLSHLIENVLDFARIEEGKRHYQFEEQALHSVVQETVELFAARAADTDHEIKLSLEPGRAQVDRGAVQQAVANLLDNAMKFSPAGSTISVTLGWNDNGWSVAVSDDGPGIPESENERIFERFHRLGDELRRETKGTGIGLSIVQHIAEAHGGSARVSNNPTTFTLTAPISPPVDS